MPRSSPQVTIEIPEKLFQRAEEHAQRLEKRRDVMYAEALAKSAARSPPVDSTLTRAWLPDRWPAGGHRAAVGVSVGNTGCTILEAKKRR
jgi:predicted transcriptional regulator